VMNKNSKIFLSPPHIGEEEKQFVQEAFDSNWIAPLGPNVDAFEQELAQKVGSKGAAALSSGTAAIHLALRLLGVGRGDRVFCSTFTFVASANPILYQEAEPVFIDSEPTTWNMSPQALERALNDAKRNNRLPKAVIVVNLYGQSARMDEILELCSYYKIPVIEDAAESLGASYANKASGTFGYFGVYSFNGNKIITTSGGGMLVSDDLDALKKARFWATQARDPFPYYHHSEVGFNYRMSNVLAGIGRGQLRALENRVQARRNVFNNYFEAFKGMEGVSFMPEVGFSTRWLTTVCFDFEITGVKPKMVIDALEKENIESRHLWKPLHTQPLFQKHEFYAHSDNVVVSEALFEQGICLPSGSSLTKEEQDRIIDIVKEVVKNKKIVSK